MPHEPRSARQSIEAASAFAQREMLAEARQALQGARTALAQRSDVGTAHWCDACLVALEIAARDGEVPELEAEAAQLRSLTGGGRYWTEQARARISEHASRIGPTRLDRVFAALAGEAVPAAPHREHPGPDGAQGVRPASPEPLAPSHVLTAPENGSEERVAAFPKGFAELDSVVPGFPADTRTPRPAGPENWTEQCAAEFAGVEPDTPGIPITDAPPRPSLAPAPARANGAEMLDAAPRLEAPARHLPRSRVQVGVVAVLALIVALLASRSATRVSAGLSGSASAAPHALRAGQNDRALKTANPRPEGGESAAHKHLALGRALLASGDTAGAVAASTKAAQSDSRGTVAWIAAETLARLPGHAGSAADAYLLAFAANPSVDRVEPVARAQELAGRPDRARRVRDQLLAR